MRAPVSENPTTVETKDVETAGLVKVTPMPIKSKTTDLQRDVLKEDKLDCKSFFPG